MDDDRLALAAEAPWIADASCLEPIEVPDRPEARCKDAPRALAYAILGVLCFGLVFGPLALALGQRARLAIAAEPRLRGAATARAAIAIGQVGLALHLTIAMTVLPWLLFALPLISLTP
jgi:hypothetical protein